MTTTQVTLREDHEVTLDQVLRIEIDRRKRTDSRSYRISGLRRRIRYDCLTGKVRGAAEWKVIEAFYFKQDGTVGRQTVGWVAGLRPEDFPEGVLEAADAEANAWLQGYAPLPVVDPERLP